MCPAADSRPAATAESVGRRGARFFRAFNVDANPSSVTVRDSRGESSVALPRTSAKSTGSFKDAKNGEGFNSLHLAGVGKFFFFSYCTQATFP